MLDPSSPTAATALAAPSLAAPLLHRLSNLPLLDAFVAARRDNTVGSEDPTGVSADDSPTSLMAPACSSRPAGPQFDVRRPQKESISSRVMGSIRKLQGGNADASDTTSDAGVDSEVSAVGSSDTGDSVVGAAVASVPGIISVPTSSGSTGTTAAVAAVTEDSSSIKNNRYLHINTASRGSLPRFRPGELSALSKISPVASIPSSFGPTASLASVSGAVRNVAGPLLCDSVGGTPTAADQPAYEFEPPMRLSEFGQLCQDDSGLAVLDLLPMKRSLGNTATSVYTSVTPVRRTSLGSKEACTNTSDGHTTLIHGGGGGSGSEKRDLSRDSTISPLLKKEDGLSKAVNARLYGSIRPATPSSDVRVEVNLNATYSSLDTCSLSSGSDLGEGFSFGDGEALGASELHGNHSAISPTSTRPSTLRSDFVSDELNFGPSLTSNVWSSGALASSILGPSASGTDIAPMPSIFSVGAPLPAPSLAFSDFTPTSALNVFSHQSSVDLDEHPTRLPRAVPLRALDRDTIRHSEPLPMSTVADLRPTAARTFLDSCRSASLTSGLGYGDGDDAPRAPAHNAAAAPAWPRLPALFRRGSVSVRSLKTVSSGSSVATFTAGATGTAIPAPKKKASLPEFRALPPAVDTAGRGGAGAGAWHHWLGRRTSSRANSRLGDAASEDCAASSAGDDFGDGSAAAAVVGGGSGAFRRAVSRFGSVLNPRGSPVLRDSSVVAVSEPGEAGARGSPSRARAWSHSRPSWFAGAPPRAVSPVTAVTTDSGAARAVMSVERESLEAVVSADGEPAATTNYLVALERARMAATSDPFSTRLNSDASTHTGSPAAPAPSRLFAPRRSARRGPTVGIASDMDAADAGTDSDADAGRDPSCSGTVVRVPAALSPVRGVVASPSE
ncbi:hypothetical protein HK405_005842 [Cladochytrium tenue]|nr:hypothetical protein HK405_005842 [Cladochytrium tenue]